MLQQTTVATVIPYYEAFIKKWPTILSLSKADVEEVLVMWQGLGYYRRARFLHACAKAVVERYDGVFPECEKKLRALPGIGSYTAGALLCIGMNKPGFPVDGNIRRVLTRLFKIDKPVKDVDVYLKKCHEQGLMITHHPHDTAQAFMDLGSSICTPTNPKCFLCPLNIVCEAFKTQQQNTLPQKNARTKTPTRYAHIYIVQESERIYMRKRSEKGVLQGLMEFPMVMHDEKPHEPEDALLLGGVRHIFSHFKLEASLYAVDKDHTNLEAFTEPFIWCDMKDISAYALSSLMKKVEKRVLEYMDSPRQAA
jgi:A/G-specific adenine glycosylase